MKTATRVRSAQCCASQKKSRHAGRTQHEETAWDLNRPDLQCSAGEISIDTSKPTDKDHSKAIRMAEYSGDPSHQRAIQEFRFETLEPTVVEHAAPLGRARGSNIGSSSAGTPRNDWWHSRHATQSCTLWSKEQHRPLRCEVWPQTGIEPTS